MIDEINDELSQSQNEKDVTELASKLSGIQLEKSTALRLPQLFGSNPKSANSSKRFYEERKPKESFSDDHPDDEGFNSLDNEGLSLMTLKIEAFG